MDNTKLQQFREQAIAAGYDAADVDKFLTAKQEQMATQQLIQRGILAPEDIAKTDPISALAATQNAPQGSSGQSDLLTAVLNGDISIKDLDSKERTKVLKEAADLGFAIPKETKDADPTSLRKEFRQETNDLGFKEIRKQWENIKGAGTGAAGDISIMYSYIKMLDPNSAVREGELALAAEAAGLPDRIVKAAKKLDKGAALGPEIRNQIVGQSLNLYNTSAQRQKEVNSFYSELAEDQGLDPKDVVGAVGEIEIADPEKYKVAGVQEGTTEGAQLPGFLQDIPENIFGTKKITDYAAQAPGMAARGVVAGGQNILDLLKGNKQAAIQRSEEFRPEVERYQELEKGAKQQIGAKFEAMAGLGALRNLLAGGARAAAGEVAGEATRVSRPLTAKFFPKVALKARGAATEAAETAGTKFSTKNIIEAGKKYIEDDPLAEGIGKKVLSNLKGKNLSPNQLLNKLKVWNKAYTAAGKAGKSSKAGLFDELARAARSELGEKAPQLAKAQSDLASAYKTGNIAKKIINPITLAAGASSAVTGGLLYGLLGKR